MRLSILSGLFILIILSSFVLYYSSTDGVGQAHSGLIDDVTEDTQFRGNTGKVYVYGSGLIASKDDHLMYHLSDHLGSGRLTTDQNAFLQSKDASYPYGRELEHHSYADSEQKYLFTGKESDSEYLQYFGARYYQPTNGRFISPDPLPRTGNNYAYAANNPLRFIDPTGMDEEDPHALLDREDLVESIQVDNSPAFQDDTRTYPDPSETQPVDFMYIISKDILEQIRGNNDASTITPEVLFNILLKSRNADAEWIFYKKIPLRFCPLLLSTKKEFDVMTVVASDKNDFRDKMIQRSSYRPSFMIIDTHADSEGLYFGDDVFTGDDVDSLRGFPTPHTLFLTGCNAGDSCVPQRMANRLDATVWADTAATSTPYLRKRGNRLLSGWTVEYDPIPFNPNR